MAGYTGLGCVLLPLSFCFFEDKKIHYCTFGGHKSRKTRVNIHVSCAISYINFGGHSWEVEDGDYLAFQRSLAYFCAFIRMSAIGMILEQILG